MLQTVSIQNFKSLRDVSVRLQKINLLIGPNNSGKSNFLKALAFIKEHLEGRIQPGLVDLNRIYFGQEGSLENSRLTPILFYFDWNANMSPLEKTIYQLELYGYSDIIGNLMSSELIGCHEGSEKADLKLWEIEKWVSLMYDFHIAYDNNESYIRPTLSESILLLTRDNLGYSNRHFYSKKRNVMNLEREHSNGDFLKTLSVDGEYLNFDLVTCFSTIKIYKPDPSKITKESLLLFDKNVNEDCSNLVAFLDNMRDEHPEVWNAIEKDLNKCIPQFEGINFGKVKINGNQESIGKRFGLRDNLGKTYWADELSEGTIYFLALLAIVHQPNPPKILLLEEPEKGIHPRRIAEVMNLIFRLAEDKDIQIILTSHSTQVVDEFQDMPESVFVFDLIDGETKIKNLLTDIIEPDNQKAEQQNYAKLDFSKNSLGEHWAIGFLGGVPAK